MAFRVIQWGVGYTGTSAVRYIANNPHLDLVGIKCFTESKVGLTAQDICGCGQEGAVTATRDVDELLAIDADCVVFMPRYYFDDPSIPGGPSEQWMAELVQILESGKNVTSPVVAGIHWQHLKNPQGFLDRINAACDKGASSVTFTGFDPGYSTDYLAFVLGSAVGEATQIRTWEFLDYATYPVPEILNALGLGIAPDQLEQARESVRIIWSPALYLLGDAMGEKVDKISVEIEPYLAPATFSTEGGTVVKEGTTGAIWWKAKGFASGKERYIINHITRMSPDMAPDWPNMGPHDGGYRVEIDAFPPLTADMPMGTPHGTGTAFGDAMVMTAARCINSIEAVVNAPPGLKTFIDLPPVGGKYTFVD